MRTILKRTKKIIICLALVSLALISAFASMASAEPDSSAIASGAAAPSAQNAPSDGKLTVEPASSDGSTSIDVSTLGTPVETWDISATSSDSVTAKLYNDPENDGYYVLVISGSGRMKDWFSPSWPWSTLYQSSIKKVSVCSGVTNIGPYAFSGCSNLAKIEIPSGVTSIGDRTFYGCYSLTSIEIPSGMTSIGDDTFYGCTHLKEVHITDIDAWCRIYFESPESNPLYYAKKLLLDGELVTKVLIPSDVVKIKEYTFYNCSSLTSIEIPSGVTNIGSNAFNYCTALREVHITDIDAWCRIDFGSGSGANPVYYAKKLFLNGELVTKVIVPSDVTEINSTFAGCQSLSSIELPASLTSLGNYAFSYCSSLEHIEIPSGVTSIGYDAFSGCSSLKSIEIPSGVTSIFNSAFSGCSSLESIEIPSGVTSIGDRAFYDCSSLGSIELPSGLTTIGYYAFRGCSSLESIELPSGVTSIGDYAFSGCSSLGGNIAIPSGVTSIGNYVFRGCSSLESIELPSGVTSIGNFAFSGCSSLESIELPSRVTSIGSSAFSGCSSLGGNIAIPSGVTSIGYSAFYGCSSLESIEIPSGVTSIGDFAFYGCSSLGSIELPSGLTSIGYSAFSGCSSLGGNIAIPSGVTSISSSTFSGCSSLGSVVIPSGVTSIGMDAFYGCSSLEIIEIPSGVTSIGNSAFRSCTKLNLVIINTSSIASRITNSSSNGYLTSYASTVAIKSDITSVGSYITNIFTNVATFAIPGDGESVDYVVYSKHSHADDSDVWSNNGDGTKSCSECGITVASAESEVAPVETWDISATASDNVTAKLYADPENEGYYDLVISGNGNMKNWVAGSYSTCPWHNNSYQVLIVKVEIQNGVTNIGEDAFYELSALKDVIIGESVSVIGRAAFYKCKKLQTLEYDAISAQDLESWNRVFDYAGKDTDGLTITIGSMVKRIPAYIFCPQLEAESLSTINISSLIFEEGSTCDEIGTWAFSNVYIESLYINDIAWWCSFSFDDGRDSPVQYVTKMYCHGQEIVHIVIPENVESIGAFTFCYQNFESITIGAGVNEIKNFAFYSCENVKLIKIESAAIASAITKVSSCGYLSESAETILIASEIKSIGNYITSSFTNVNILPIFNPDGTFTEYNVYSKHSHANDSTLWVDNGDGTRTCSSCGIVAEKAEEDNYVEMWDISAKASDSVTAKLYDDPDNAGYYHLIIKGSGNMTDWSAYTAVPWYVSYRNLIKKVTIESGITNIGKYAFYKCEKLTEVSIADSVSAIGSHAFYNCTSLTSVDIPLAVTSIQEYTFYNCTSLTSISMPDAVGVFGQYAFAYCAALTDLTLPTSLKSVNKYALAGCSGLGDIKIPDGVTSIYDYAFANVGFKNLSIPDSVTYIGTQAFSGCKSLISVTVGKGLSSLGRFAFRNCNSISNFTVDAENASFTAVNGVLFSKNGEKLINYPVGKMLSSYTVPEGVKIIENGAFENAKYLTEIVIPDTVITVSGYAFASCEKLVNVSFGSGLTGIGEYAFYACKSVTAITIPESVTIIGSSAFSACRALTSIVIPKSVNALGSSAFSSCDALKLIIIDSPDIAASISSSFGLNLNKTHTLAFASDITEINSFIVSNYTNVSALTLLLENGTFADYNVYSRHTHALDSAAWVENGNGTSTCSTCGIVKRNCIHENTTLIENPASCIATGERYTVCDDCGKVIGEKEILPISSHAVGTWIEEVEPSCSEEGIAGHYYCSVCEKYLDADENVIDTLILPKKDHNTTTHEAKEPTCLEVGWYEYDTCADCDYTTYVEIPKAEHKIGEWFIGKAAQCEEDGELGHYYCSSCENYLDKDKNILETTVIKAPGHDKIYHELKLPTCEEIGWNAYETCSKCDYSTYAEIGPKGHVEVIDPGEEATCTSVGLTEGKRCANCPTVFVAQQVIPKLKHTLTKVDKADSTCTEAGWIEHYTCATCEHYYDAEENVLSDIKIPAKGHTEISVTDTQPTCVEGGVGHVECEVCDVVLIDAVYLPANGHTYGEWKTQAEATCTQNGVRIRSCIHCYDEGYTQTGTIYKLGHNWRKLTECSSETVNVYQCKRCNEIFDAPRDADENAFIEYIRCDSDFVFYIKSSEDEKYIRDNLNIINTNVERAYGSDAIEKYTLYTLKSVGDGVYEVRPEKEYVGGATYRVEIFGRIEFRDYWQSTLVLLIRSPIYIPIIDITPYVPKIDIPDISFIFDITYLDIEFNLDDWLFYDGDYFRVIDILDNLDGTISIIVEKISEIDQRIRELLDEIRKKGGFQSFADQFIRFEDIAALWDSDRITALFAEGLENSESFLAFKEIVGDAAMDYLINEGIEAGTFKNEYITLKPIFERSENDDDAIVIGFSFELNYTIKKKGNDGKELNLGTISVNLIVKNEMKIEYGMGLTSVEGALLTAYLDLTQDSTASVELSAKYHMEYDLEDHEHQFIVNTSKDRRIVHRYYCQYIEQTKYQQYLKAIDKEEMLRYVNEEEYHVCTLCQPTDDSFIESTTFMYNKNTKAVHREGCFHIEDSKNCVKITSLSTLEGANYCDWCMVTRSERDFETYIKNSLKYADWASVTESIRKTLEEDGAKDLVDSVAVSLGGKKSEDVVGINLGNYQIYYDGFFAVSAELYFVFHFDLEASFKFEYIQDFTHNMRLEYNIMPNLLTTPPVNVEQWFEVGGSTVSLEMVGKLHSNAGVKLVLQGGILGELSATSTVMKPLIGIKLDVEGGVYIQLTGIVSYKKVVDDDGKVTESHDYGAARFETGLYIKFDAAIKMWTYEFEIFATEHEFPLAVIGFDKVYYGYTEDEMELDIHYDRALNDGISVKYFDMDKMEQKTESITLSGVFGLYSVTLELRDGVYCEIVDGKIVIDPDAPHYFTDVLYVTFVGEASGWEIREGWGDKNARFCLRTYEIYLNVYNHSFDESAIAIPPTCMEEGYMAFTCTECGHVVNSVLDKVAHKFNSEVTVIEPTCTDGGYSVTVCVYEGCTEEHRFDIKEPLGHKHDKVIERTVSCTENGYVIIQCSICNNSIITEAREAYGHNYADSDNWILVELGDCATPSKYERPCMNDGCASYVIDYRIDFEHTLISTDETAAKRPTCTEPGWEAYEICSECGYSTKVEIEPSGHVWKPWGVHIESTCSSTGTDRRYCLKCPSYEERDSEKKDHVFGDWYHYVFSTCHSKGEERRDCKSCDAYEARSTDMIDHVLVAYPGQDPTCAEGGWKPYEKCANCSYSTYEAIGPSGHKYELYHTDFGNCYVATVKYYACTVDGCDASYSETIPPSHALKDVSGKEATCVEEGWTDHKLCVVCGIKEDYSVIPATGKHKLGEVITVLPTADTVGSRYRVCSVCSYEELSCEIPKLPFSDGLVYELSMDGTYYVVTGVNEEYFEGGEVHITPEYLGLPVLAIGDSAFYQNEYLTGVHLPDSVVRVGKNAFAGCISLSKFDTGDSLVTINASAFANCISLEEVTLGKSMSSLGELAFAYCNALRAVYFNSDGLYGLSAGDKAFINSGKGSEGIVVIFGENITEVPNYLFESANVTGIFFEGNNCAVIGKHAFDSCARLTSVEIPRGVEKIGDYAFSRATALKEIELPSTLKVIGSYAFAYTSIEELVIPDSVEMITGYAFSSIDELKTLSIGEGTRLIEAGAFLESVNVQSIEISEANTAYYAEGNCIIDRSLAMVVCGFNSSLIPSDGSVKRIGAYAFYNCSNADIAIPDSVIFIGEYALHECYHKASRYTFFENVYYLGNDDNPYVVAIKLSDSSLERAELHPDTRIIYMNAFARSSLTSIKIPDGVTHIGSFAFLLCESLRTVEFGSSLVVIDGAAFADCRLLNNVVLPDSLGVIGASAFSNCSSLEKIVIPDGVTEILHSTFENCEMLYEVILPEGLVGIGNRAFFGARALERIDLPETLTFIGEYAFYDCSSLKEAIIPDSVSSLGNYAFAGCDSIEYVKIGSSVKEMDSTFNGCTAINVVVFDSAIVKYLYSYNSCGYVLQYADTVLVRSDITEIGTYVKNCFKFEEIIAVGTTEYASFSNHAHAWENVFVESEWQQCVQNGHCVYECTVCGVKTDEYIPMHSLTVNETKDPTCTEIGWNAYESCPLCGYTTREELPALGHDMIGYEAKAPTCTEIGWNAYESCSRCEHTTYEELPAHNHAGGEWITKIPAVLPTPTVSGKTAGAMCSVCGEITVEPCEVSITDMENMGDASFRIDAVSLDLAESICAFYKVRFDEQYSNQYMVFVFGGEEFVVTESKVESGTGRLVYRFVGAPAYKMAENIVAYVYSETADGEYVRNMLPKYSIMQYCVNQLKKSTITDEFRTVISDVLALGAANQIYEGYKTDELVTDLVRDMGYTLTPTAYAGIDASKNIQAMAGDRYARTNWSTANLLIGSNIKVQLKLVTENAENVTVKISVAGEDRYFAAKDLKTENDKYVVVIDYLTSKQYDEPITATLYENGEQVGGILTYSVNSYLYRNAEKSTHTEEMRALLQTLFVYGETMKAYFTKQ